MSIATFRSTCKQIAQDYYGELPFHNFSHAARVEQRAYELCTLLQLDELTTQGILLGAWMHDAGYHHLLPSTFSSKEDYSIHLMEKGANEILTLSYPTIIKQIIAIAADGIQGTKINCTNFSTEARRVLRAADIPNLGNSDETIFFANSANIYQEINILHETSLKEQNKYPYPIDTFQESQIPLLTDLLTKTKQGIPKDPYFFPGYYDNFSLNIARALSPEFVKYI